MEAKEMELSPLDFEYAIIMPFNDI